MPYAKPLIVITRPRHQGVRFADAVREAIGATANILIAPVLQIDPVPVDLPLTNDVIFSSANAVAALGQSGNGRLAFCVGERTAMAAREAGFEPRIAGGSASSLIDLVLRTATDTQLIHARGEHSRGDIASSLRAKGRHVDDVVVYKQSEIPLTNAALSQITDAQRVILPIFSPRTASILTRQLAAVEMNCTAIALSGEIAAQVHFAKEIDVAPSISAQSVIKCLERHIAA